MTFRPFLSHQSKDKTLVRKIAEGLIRCGMEPILDVWNFVPGDSLTKSMNEGVKSASAFVLFWSQHSAESDYVEYEREIGLVEAKKRDEFRVICVVLDDTPPPTEHSFRLYIDWKEGKRRGKQFDKNLLALERALQGKPIEDRPSALTPSVSHDGDTSSMGSSTVSQKAKTAAKGVAYGAAIEGTAIGTGYVAENATDRMKAAWERTKSLAELSFEIFMRLKSFGFAVLFTLLMLPYMLISILPALLFGNGFAGTVEHFQAGGFVIPFSGAGLITGTYIAKVRAGDEKLTLQSLKAMLIRTFVCVFALSLAFYIARNHVFSRDEFDSFIHHHIFWWVPDNPYYRIPNSA